MARGKLEVLNALDVAKIQLYHFTAIVIAGMGFFTDAYDLFSIPAVTKLLGRIYYTIPGSSTPGILPVKINSAVTGVALVGTLFGQLFFGWFGDKLGRKKAYGATLLLMIFCSLASGLSFGHHARGTLATLCFFRFWLGIGIGGDYPLSATIMSEYANKKTRGSFIAAVFAMQGIGILAAGIVGLVVSAAFEKPHEHVPYSVSAELSCPPRADYVWRIILMLGAVPAVFTYYFRMQMPETARYTTLIAKNATKAANDMAKVLNVELDPEVEKLERLVDEPSNQYGLFSSEFVHRHGLHLLGTSTCWFLLDIAFYSQNLFQKNLFTAVHWIPPAQNMSAIQEVWKISRAQTLVALCGTVPGYWVTVALIDRIGRWVIQLQGFFFMSVFLFTLGIPFHHWTLHKVPFIIMYSLTFFFSNFGPNATTFVVPAEIFPARLRSTCYGISAAAGKAGSIVGSFGFLWASEPDHAKEVDFGYPKGIGPKYSLIILGIASVLGMFFTFLIPDANGKSLEEMSGENRDDSTDAVEDSGQDKLGVYHQTSPV